MGNIIDSRGDLNNEVNAWDAASDEALKLMEDTMTTKTREDL